MTGSRGAADPTAQLRLVGRAIGVGALIGAGAGVATIVVLLLAEPVRSLVSGEVSWTEALGGFGLSFTYVLIAAVLGAGVGVVSGLLAGLVVSLPYGSWSRRRVVGAVAAGLPVVPLGLVYPLWGGVALITLLAVVGSWFLLPRVAG